ncbi:MAG: SRPBCC family protein [Micromonosporaceae bacterium]
MSLREIEIRFSVESDIPPERVVAAATDFTDRRPEIWAAIDPRVYRVHYLGATTADVTEGSALLGGIWAREQYDWSTQGVVRAEVQDLNVFRRGSSWELRVSPGRDGGSSIAWLTRRVPRGPKGHLLGLLMRLGARRALEQEFRRTLGKLAPPAVP